MKKVRWLLMGLLIAGITAILNNTGKQPFSWLLWAGFTLLYAYKNKDFVGVGLTRNEFKNAVFAGIVAGIAYGLFRGIVLSYIPSLNIMLESGLAAVMDGYLSGKFPLTNIYVSKLQFISIFAVMSLIAVSSWELFYRGFLFTRFNKYFHWLIAAVITAFINGLAHFDVGATGFYHSLVLFTIAGWLMYRYKNVAASILFHYIHFFVTFFVFLLLR